MHLLGEKGNSAPYDETEKEGLIGVFNSSLQNYADLKPLALKKRDHDNIKIHLSHTIRAAQIGYLPAMAELAKWSVYYQINKNSFRNPFKEFDLRSRTQPCLTVTREVAAQEADKLYRQIASLESDDSETDLEQLRLLAANGDPKAMSLYAIRLHSPQQFHLRAPLWFKAAFLGSTHGALHFSKEHAFHLNLSLRGAGGHDINLFDPKTIIHCIELAKTERDTADAANELTHKINHFAVRHAYALQEVRNVLNDVARPRPLHVRYALKLLRQWYNGDIRQLGYYHFSFLNTAVIKAIYIRFANQESTELNAQVLKILTDFDPSLKKIPHQQYAFNGTGAKKNHVAPKNENIKPLITQLQHGETVVVEKLLMASADEQLEKHLKITAAVIKSMGILINSNSQDQSANTHYDLFLRTKENRDSIALLENYAKNGCVTSMRNFALLCQSHPTFIENADAKFANWISKAAMFGDTQACFAFAQMVNSEKHGYTRDPMTIIRALAIARTQGAHRWHARVQGEYNWDQKVDQFVANECDGYVKAAFALLHIKDKTDTALQRVKQQIPGHENEGRRFIDNRAVKKNMDPDNSYNQFATALAHFEFDIMQIDYVTLHAIVKPLAEAFLDIMDAKLTMKAKNKRSAMTTYQYQQIQIELKTAVDAMNAPLGGPRQTVSQVTERVVQAVQEHGQTFRGFLQNIGTNISGLRHRITAQPPQVEAEPTEVPKDDTTRPSGQRSPRAARGQEHGVFMPVPVRQGGIARRRSVSPEAGIDPEDMRNPFVRDDEQPFIPRPVDSGNDE